MQALDQVISGMGTVNAQRVADRYSTLKAPPGSQEGGIGGNRRVCEREKSMRALCGVWITLKDFRLKEGTLAQQEIPQSAHGAAQPCSMLCLLGWGAWDVG